VQRFEDQHGQLKLKTMTIDKQLGSRHSQWSWTVVMWLWSRRVVPVIRRAAALWGGLPATVTSGHQRFRTVAVVQSWWHECLDHHLGLTTSTDSERMLGRSWRSW